MSHKTAEAAKAEYDGITPENYFDYRPNKADCLRGTWSKSELHYAGHHTHRWAAGVRKTVTAAMQSGSLVDTFITEPAKMDELYVISDEEDARKKGYKDAKAKADAEGKTLVKRSDLVHAQGMCDSIMNHHEAKQMLSGDFQRVFTGTVALSGEHGDVHVAMKGKTDAVIDVEPNVIDIWDLKRSSAETDEEIAKIARTLGYNWQEHFYSRLAEQNGFFVRRFLFVFVHPEPPYRVRVVEFGDEAIRGAELSTQKAFSTIYEIGHGTLPTELDGERLLLGGPVMPPKNHYWDTVKYAPKNLVDVYF